MVFLIFLFFLIFTRPTFAAANLQITVAPISIVAGNSFPVSFIVENADVGTTFHYKIYGGVGDDNYGIKTVNGSVHLPYTGGGYSWKDDFPFFVINESGSANIFGNAYIESSAPAGEYNISIAINNGSTITYPNLKTISVSVAPTPIPTNTPTPTSTPTPTPTKIPTNTPTPTPTKTPTNTPTPTFTPTLTPTPTKIPTATPTIDLNRYEGSFEATASVVSVPVEETIEEEITSTPTPVSDLVLGESIENKKTKQNFLPLIFIISGGILLMTPLIITKIKKQ